MLSRNVSPAGKVYYYFYNRNTQNNIIYGKGDVPTAIINSANFADLEEKLRHRFIITAETQIWIHGCAQFVNAYSNEDIEKIVKSKNHNVIIVDWTYSYSPFTCYTMKKQQFVVGEQLAEFVELLMRVGTKNVEEPEQVELKKQQNMKKLVIVSYGIGTLVGAVCANRLKAYNLNLKVFIAINPVGKFVDANGSIIQKIADFLYVIHPSFKRKPLGNVDVYLYGGKKNPAYKKNKKNSVYGLYIYIERQYKPEENEYWMIKCASYEEIKRGECTENNRGAPYPYLDEKNGKNIFGDISDDPDNRPNGVFYVDTSSPTKPDKSLTIKMIHPKKTKPNGRVNKRVD